METNSVVVREEKTTVTIILKKNCTIAHNAHLITVPNALTTMVILTNTSYSI